MPGLLIKNNASSSGTPNYSEDCFGITYDVYNSDEPGTVIISLFIDDLFGTTGYAIWKDGEVTNRWGSLAE